MGSGRSLTPWRVLPALVPALALCAPLVATAGSLWTLDLDSEIQFQRVTPLGSLLVSTEQALVAVDPATGKTLWKRDDIKGLKECNYDEIAGTAFGMFDMGGTTRGVEVLDLATGEKKWDASSLPMKSSQGVMVVPHKGMLIIAGAPKQKGLKTTLIGVDGDTGEMKWQKDGLFTKNVVLRDVPGCDERHSIEGSQPPVFDTDSTAILFLTKEGPVKIDVNTGEKLWTADKLEGEDPSAVCDGYAPTLYDSGVVYVPYKHSVMAVDAKTGQPMWPKDHNFKSRVAQMALTPQGLVVRGQPQSAGTAFGDGAPFIDCLDPKSGESTWKKPFKDMNGATTFDIQGDRVFIVADGELFSIGLGGGDVKSVMKIQFKGNEVPTSLEVHGDEYVLVSSQNVMGVTPGGEIKYHAFYEPPEQSGWIKTLKAAAFVAANVARASPKHYSGKTSSGGTWNLQLGPSTRDRYKLYGSPDLWRRFKASTNAFEYAAIQTTVVEGRKKGSGLVKISKADGKGVARCYLGDKTPKYELDEIDGRVFFMKTKRRIVAYEF